eukprot:g14190.t1
MPHLPRLTLELLVLIPIAPRMMDGILIALYIDLEITTTLTQPPMIITTTLLPDSRLVFNFSLSSSCS